MSFKISRNYEIADNVDLNNIEIDTPIPVTDLDRLPRVVTVVDIYEDQVRGWYFDIIKESLIDNPHAGFVILMICISFFEHHAHFCVSPKDLNGGSSVLFKKGFNVFAKWRNDNLSISKSVDEDIIPEVIYGLRNSLFHVARIGIGVELNISFSESIRLLKVNPKTIQKREIVTKNILVLEKLEINPIKLFEELLNYFTNFFLNEVRNKDNAQKIFIDGWNRKMNEEIIINNQTLVQQYPTGYNHPDLENPLTSSGGTIQPSSNIQIPSPKHNQASLGYVDEIFDNLDFSTPEDEE